jgi:hypothetical protein
MMSVLWIKCGYFICFVFTGFNVIVTMHCMGLVPHPRDLDPLELERNYDYNWNCQIALDRKSMYSMLLHIIHTEICLFENKNYHCCALFWFCGIHVCVPFMCLFSLVGLMSLVFSLRSEVPLLVNMKTHLP